MCRSNCSRSLCHIAIYQVTIYYYYYYYYYYLVKRMFSSIWLIWKVVAIRLSHRKQRLIVTSFEIVSSALLHLNQIFCFYLYLIIKKVTLLPNSNNFYKLQRFFNHSHIAISLLTCDPHPHLVTLTFTWHLSYQG